MRGEWRNNNVGRIFLDRISSGRDCSRIAHDGVSAVGPPQVSHEKNKNILYIFRMFDRGFLQYLVYAGQGMICSVFRDIGDSGDRKFLHVDEQGKSIFVIL